MLTKILFQALENSSFTLKERVLYFEKKWQKEHFFELTFIMVIIVFFIIYGFVKDNGIQYLFIIFGFLSAIYETNRKMAYIEKNAYGKNSNITFPEFQNSIIHLTKYKSILNQFRTKEEAIHYLIKETNLSPYDCSKAYDFIMKLDLDKIRK